MWTMQELLRAVSEQGASDLVLSVGTPPQLRILGELQPLDDCRLKPEDLEALCDSILGKSQKSLLETRKSIDFSMGFPGLSRFRFNIYHQRGSLALAARIIPFDIPGFQELGLPEDVFTWFSMRRQGMVLVSGAAGSGKSTSLAAMVDYMNAHRAAHIICLEDPIEYLHHHGKSTID